MSNHLENDRVIKPVSEILIHEQWNHNTETFKNDIAILIIEERIFFSRFIQPICLTLSIGDVTKGTVVSWGRNAMSHTYNEDIPTKIDVTIIQSEGECYRQENALAKIGSETSFCAGDPGVKVCKGDSGSGLFVLIDSTYYLKGIVSASQFKETTGCSPKNLAVYTDVLKYIDFIGVDVHSKLCCYVYNKVYKMISKKLQLEAF